MPDTDKYYPYTVRWQEREGFLLWIDRPEMESLWSNAQTKAPIFDTYQQLNSFALSLDKQLQNQAMQPTNLDAVAAWVAGDTERPVRECLRA